MYHPKDISGCSCVHTNILLFLTNERFLYADLPDNELVRFPKLFDIAITITANRIRTKQMTKASAQKASMELEWSLQTTWNPYHQLLIIRTLLDSIVDIFNALLTINTFIKHAVLCSKSNRFVISLDSFVVYPKIKTRLFHLLFKKESKEWAARYEFRFRCETLSSVYLSWLTTSAIVDSDVFIWNDSFIFQKRTSHFSDENISDIK